MRLKSELYKKEQDEIIEQIIKMLDLENIPKFNIEKIKNLKLDLENFKRQLIYENHSKNLEEYTFSELSVFKNNLKPEIESLKNKIKNFPKYENLVLFPVNFMQVLSVFAITCYRIFNRQ